MIPYRFSILRVPGFLAKMASEPLNLDVFLIKHGFWFRCFLIKINSDTALYEKSGVNMMGGK